MSGKVHEFDPYRKKLEDAVNRVYEKLEIIDNPEDDVCLNEEDLSDDSFAADPFFQAMSLSQEDRDAYIDSGAFHATIEGYLILAMKEKNYPAEEIKAVAKELRDNILKIYSAKSARIAAAELSSERKEPSHPTGNNIFRLKK